MPKNNRECICCGKAYKYCNTCADQILEPTWKAIYCSENCKKVFMTTTNYLADDITEDQARNSFEQCDLSGKENFKKRIIEVIDEVLKTNTSTDIEESSEEKSDEKKIVRPMKRAKKN